MKKFPNYVPMREFTDLMPEVSGNAVNGLGETRPRRASPFFWHPPERQTHGALQQKVTDYQQAVPEIARYFSSAPPGGRGPEPITQAAATAPGTAAHWAAELKQFALGNEADLVGIAAMEPMYVYEGYDIAEPWVVLIGVGMEYEELSQAPATGENPAAAVVVAREYNRAARSCRKLRNFILSKGYYAKAYQGPYASALNMIPAAIEAGFGELGTHGSIINRELGSRFRLSAVTTDMPLVTDARVNFGIDDYCARCNACTNACPPQAIFEDKQLVRGVEKWYVDFDKCIPYFGEALGCGICIVRCPWSRPGAADRILHKLARRDAQSDTAEVRT
jgi:Pyruvate/2-oxoacid:ferredoxin oxidoreductase delta subunit